MLLLLDVLVLAVFREGGGLRSKGTTISMDWSRALQLSLLLELFHFIFWCWIAELDGAGSSFSYPM